ncbi:MAG: OsmC family protein [Salibacteraceae bacterium]
MTTVHTSYLQQLRTSSKHLRSGSQVETDAPIDNNGKGERFSPTDLVATALGTCMLTVMGIYARKYGLVLDGARTEVVKVMAANPRRIKEIQLEIHLPGSHWTGEQRKELEEVGRNCPVALSLHPDLEQTVVFHYF